MFYRLGYNTFIFDYRGYGESSGRLPNPVLISMPSRHGVISPKKKYSSRPHCAVRRIPWRGDALACGARKAGVAGAGFRIYLRA